MTQTVSSSEARDIEVQDLPGREVKKRSEWADENKGKSAEICFLAHIIEIEEGCNETFHTACVKFVTDW
ncbi:MAG: hypothetical protein DRH43_11970 [Deltaproteobacteria bacterium]|nr:MAG: hypothetical protein DRH43_11970 [Deltaproteobacteria bacterium]